jgi:hypothetical protein
MKVFSLSVLGVLLCSGCATMIHGTYDNVTVHSLETGTRIYVDGELRGTDWASARVERGKAHTITAEKDGFQSVSIQTTKSFDATSLLGILIDFGLISIPVDLISGAAWKTDPQLYTVTPIPTADSLAVQSPAPQPTVDEQPTASAPDSKPRETFEEWAARQEQAGDCGSH